MTGLVLRVIEPDRHCFQRSEGGVLGLECQRFTERPLPHNRRAPSSRGTIPLRSSNTPPGVNKFCQVSEESANCLWAQLRPPPWGANRDLSTHAKAVLPLSFLRSTHNRHLNLHAIALQPPNQINHLGVSQIRQPLEAQPRPALAFPPPPGDVQPIQALAVQLANVPCHTCDGQPAPPAGDSPAAPPYVR